jgi:hypothetical protein
VHQTVKDLRGAAGRGFDLDLQTAFVDAVRREGAVSRYALRNRYEYFAESFAAYSLHPEQLRAHDPRGFALVERALTLLRP